MVKSRQYNYRTYDDVRATRETVFLVKVRGLGQRISRIDPPP